MGGVRVFKHNIVLGNIIGEVYEIGLGKASTKIRCILGTIKRIQLMIIITFRHLMEKPQENITTVEEAEINRDFAPVDLPLDPQCGTLLKQQPADPFSEHKLEEMNRDQRDQFLSRVAVSQTVGGGGETAFSFNSIEKGQNRMSDLWAPSYRKFGYGLTLEGTCMNQKCQAFEKKVLITKGYAKFNMSKEVYNSKCPLCKEKTTNVNNLFISQTRLFRSGKISGQTQDIYDRFQHSVGDFMSFPWLNNKIVVWQYLELDVKKLGVDPTTAK